MQSTAEQSAISVTTDPSHKDHAEKTNNATDSNSSKTIVNDPAKQQQQMDAKSNSHALENNKDYQATINVLNILRRQLAQANKDVELLQELKKDALERPYEFLSELKSKKAGRRMPRLQKIVKVPDIDWTKYRFLPESRIAEQTASLARSRTQPSAFRSILEGPYPTQSEVIPPSDTVKTMQRELEKATKVLEQIPSGAVSDASDKESDDEGRSSSVAAEHGLGKGKGNRRTSVAQSGGGSIHSEDGSRLPTPEWTRSRTRPAEPDMTDDGPGYDTGADSDATRSATYNQPWTDEEQRRLEELLEIYPDEPVQSQRFLKISKALGTRSARQVASRVQKYFIKLAKLGLPVPGRVSIPPSSMSKSSRGGGSTKRGKVSKARSRGAAGMRGGGRSAVRTSGMGYNAMVSGGITNTRISGAHYLTTQGPPSALMSDDDDDDNVKELMLQVTKPAAGSSAAQEADVPSESVIHEGYACDACGVEPIIGVRYKCTVCDVSEEIDLCSKCMAVGTFANDYHTPDHPFEAIRTANALPYYADNDYVTPEYLGEYSYLGY